MNQKLAVSLLQKQGHIVQVANNGKEAVAATQSDGFDLVLMDVQMPEMDGLEATRAIRARERKTGKTLPIIAMTAHAMQGDRERCLAAGMDEYIAKPIRARELFQTIAKLLGERVETVQETSAVLPESEVVNWSEALAGVNGDDELLRDVIEAFLDEAPLLIADVRASLEARDAPKLRRAAHTLKGNMRIFGAHVATEHAFRLETMGRENDMDGAQESLQTLEDHLSRITTELSQYVGRDA